MNQEPGFLIIKLGALGDIVMTLGLLHYLQENHPTKTIYWLGSQAYQDLFAALNLKNFIYLPVSGEFVHQTRFFKKLKLSIECIKHLCCFRWEKIFLCHKDHRYRYLLQCCFLSHLIAKTPRFMSIPGRYHGEEYIRLKIQSDDNFQIPFSLPKLKLGHTKVMNRAVLALGGQLRLEPGKNLRQWPLGHYAELAKLLEKNGYEVVLVGVGARDLEDAFKEIKVKNLIGKQTLKACLETIATATFIVTCDSGPMHLGILARTQVYALFGPTLPEEKLPLNHPEYAKNIHYFSSKNRLTCSPCYDGKFYARCHDPICMRLTTPLEVMRKINESSINA
jgi:heptosyltransferase-2